jgi:hypothetical protein
MDQQQNLPDVPPQILHNNTVAVHGLCSPFSAWLFLLNAVFQLCSSHFGTDCHGTRALFVYSRSLLDSATKVMTVFSFRCPTKSAPAVSSRTTDGTDHYFFGSAKAIQLRPNVESISIWHPHPSFRSHHVLWYGCWSWLVCPLHHPEHLRPPHSTSILPKSPSALPQST